jgi:two-component system, sensor histidine kinase and response regulator
MNRCPQDSILIVDDSKKNLDIVVELLKDFDVICALEAKMVFEIVKKEQLDLILLDIMMPEMDGFEVCKLLKQDPKTKNIPVIFLTAKVDTHDIQKGFECGAVDYVTKPFHPLELKMRVKNHLNLYKYQQSLKVEVEKHIKQTQHTQQLLFQKNKQAEMGELLMYIAHQWGQPLSELGSINNYQKAKLQVYKSIPEDEIEEYLNKNEKIIQFMSQTMKTFQNFYRVSHEQEVFSMAEISDQVRCLIGAGFDYHDIDLSFIPEKNELKNYFISGSRNEFAQIFLSLLNNSKNIFIKEEIKDKKIVVSIRRINGNLVVTIEDSAGGMKSDNLKTIFEPYVSFCESSGIGLYLVKTICDKNGWLIDVNNTSNGLKFNITCKEYNKK